MKTTSNKSVSLFEFIIAVIIVLVLILAIVNMNLGQKSVIDSVSFSMAKQNFSQNASLIRAQWLLDGRPKSITFSFYSDENKISTQKHFDLSNKGWPLITSALTAEGDEAMCRKIWRDINNLDPDEQIQNYLLIKSYDDNGTNNCQFCNAGNSDECINYSSHYGVDTRTHK